MLDSKTIIASNGKGELDKASKQPCYDLLLTAKWK